jgi:hypothetical protein
LKKQLIIAAGALLVLSTAVATNVRDDAHAVSATAATQTASADVGLQAASRVVSLWKDHANAAASTPLARPL